MNKDEFKKYLELCNINKRKLSELLGLSYGSVNNWNGDDIPYPVWLKSWLENYIKAKAYDTPNDEVSIKAKKYDEIKNKVLELESDNKA